MIRRTEGSQPDERTLRQQAAMGEGTPVRTASDGRAARQASAVQNVGGHTLGVNSPIVPTPAFTIPRNVIPPSYRPAPSLATTPLIVLNIEPERPMSAAFMPNNKREFVIKGIDYQHGSLQFADGSRWVVQNREMLNQVRVGDRIVVKLSNGSYRAKPIVVSSGGIAFTPASATENAPGRVLRDPGLPGERRRELL